MKISEHQRSRNVLKISSSRKCCICPAPSEPPREVNGGSIVENSQDPFIAQPKSKPAMFIPIYWTCPRTTESPVSSRSTRRIMVGIWRYLHGRGTAKDKDVGMRGLKNKLILIFPIRKETRFIKGGISLRPIYLSAEIFAWAHDDIANGKTSAVLGEKRYYGKSMRNVTWKDKERAIENTILARRKNLQALATALDVWYQSQLWIG